MTFTALIDVAIGLSLLYLGTSLFVTIASEAIAQTFNTRGRALGPALERLLDDGAMLFVVKSLPSLRTTLKLDARDQVTAPYVDPLTVARGIIGDLAGNRADVTMTQIGNAIALLNNTGFKSVLTGMLVTARGDLAAFETALAQWFDSSLERLGEAYKKQAHLISLTFGLVAAVALNIDTIGVSQRLYADNTLRSSLADYAADFTGKACGAEQLKTCTPERIKACARLSLDDLRLPENAECASVRNLVHLMQNGDARVGQLPIGWASGQAFVDAILPWHDPLSWLLRVAGWLMTALAVALGAPFWFDLLNRFVSLRPSKPAAPDGK